MNLQREPLAAAMIVRIAGYLVAILAVVGVVTAEQQSAILDVVGILAPGAALLLDLVLAFLARQAVTPVADPRDNAGRPLAPVDGA